MGNFYFKQSRDIAIGNEKKATLFYWVFLAANPEPGWNQLLCLKSQSF